LLAAVGLVWLAPTASRAADHRDGPRITDLNNSAVGALDLNDLYIFQSPSNRNNTVFILTMSPGAGVVGPATFFPGGAYELMLNNNANSLTTEVVFQAVFSPPNNQGQQTFQLKRIEGERVERIATGITNGRPAKIRGGGQATAGIFDDPFFFDVIATARFNREATILALNRTSGYPLPPDITPETNPARHFFPPAFPNNFFGGFNTLAIVIEIPRLKLQGSRTNPNISAWIRSVADIGDGRGTAQFDRTALPGINTVIVPLTRTINGELLPGGLQDEFNLLGPEQDIALRPIAINRMMEVLGLPQLLATQLANAFLPDLANFNTTSRLGFLNGRQLKDDVIDAELQLLSNGALQGDRVVNDSYFRKKFPYIGKPNPVTSVLRSSLEAIESKQEAAGGR